MGIAWFSILASSLALAVSVQGQPGFISIDCGIANDFTYIEQNNITYMSDSQFIETGVNEIVRITPSNLKFFQLYRTVRSFPNGNRNCYNLGSVVNKGDKYLIRAYFLYGDYDGKNSTPEFDLHIGVNYWDSVSFFNATTETHTEIITIASMNFIFVCLVNTGQGIPFISALEVRPLNSSMYGVVNESQSLYLWDRFDIGRSIYKDYIRYPEDPFDLIWQTREDARWISFGTSQNVTYKDKTIEPPSTVMMTAVRPLDNSDALYYSWENDSSWQFHVYLHFAELELLGPNMTREFTVCCGNNSCHDSPIRPEYLVTTTIEYPLPLIGRYDYSCSIKKTPTSTLPPILNAIETFIIWQPPTTPTREEDVEAMVDIKETYKILERNWMGDPCVPEIYKWEGLTCNNTYSDAPAIVSLNLSSAGLKGKIAASLANLKSIQSLDLSWNYLTGPIPNFLGDLPFLSSLNLSGNQLSGLIPSNLIEKSEKGSLKLSLDGNPDLCVPGSCNRHSSKRKITIIIAASVASVVILSILLIILRRFKWRKEGFISLDCGAANGTNYINGWNIAYISDAQFIETGVNKNIRTPLNGLEQSYKTVRSFPNGDRNCYNLGSVNKSNKYLIRAYFMYGDYDGINSTPEFDLYIGVNRWTTIYFSDATDAFYIEIIIAATMNFISVCLVNTGSGTPFISALELRPLNTLYGVVNESQSLQIRRDVGGRFDVGRSIDNNYISYPEDPLDLGWLADEDASWISFDTMQNVTNKDKAIEPPSTAMMTAVRPLNNHDALHFNWTTIDHSLQFHVYMHFAELELLGPNMTREFTVCCGNNSCYNSPIRPEYLVTTTIQNPQLLSGQQNYTCSFTKTPNSNFPPILNAIEIFAILQFPTTPTREEDVEAMVDIKATYKIFMRNWMGDPCLPEIYKWKGLTCNNTHSDAPAIVSLNLSSAGLKGKIAASLANITYIQSLDLSWNNLTGPVPDFLGDLPFLSSLNLSGNQLSGLIPTNLIEKSKNGSLKLSLDGNPDLCVPGSCSRHSNKRKITILIAASVASVVILSILLIILRRFKWRKEDPVVKPNKAGDLSSSEKRRFTYAEVIAMTDNFKRSIGKGGFGAVYYGQMPDGTQVAVKMLSLQSVKLLSHMRQGSDQFQNEVQLLMRVHHRNLVPFIGYCQEGDGTALIYEYMAQGNLGSHLLGRNSNTKALNWGQRLRIALDIAQGLEYLHTGCKPSIIHRDMKSANILLNERFEAKIGDFGLSKVFFKDDEQTYISTFVKGTPGYLDPEYFRSNNLTRKSDVYGFGVVLLEMITGQPPIIQSSTDYEKTNLVDWASPIIATKDIQAILDPRLEGDYDANSLLKVAEIALACTSPRSIERPTMTDIVAELKDCLGTETDAEISCSPEIGQVGTMSSYSSVLFPR